MVLLLVLLYIAGIAGLCHCAQPLIEMEVLLIFSLG
jgi:hypothetical protein